MAKNTKLFISTAALYAIHLSVKFSSIEAPIFISSYLADILCMPFTLSLFVMIVRAVKRQPTFQLSLAMIAFAVVYISVVFEYLLPRYYPTLTADPLDVASYALGGLVYVLFQVVEFRK